MNWDREHFTCHAADGNTINLHICCKCLHYIWGFSDMCVYFSVWHLMSLNGLCRVQGGRNDFFSSRRALTRYCMCNWQLCITSVELGKSGALAQWLIHSVFTSFYSSPVIMSVIDIRHRAAQNRTKRQNNNRLSFVYNLYIKLTVCFELEYQKPTRI